MADGVCVLKDVTRSGVLAAIEEFDRLGREPFLERYGFRTSRAYLLVHEGRRYDSKPICGAAHGYDRPELGPLAAASFSGGAATVQRHLNSLGFEVVEEKPRGSSWTEEERLLALDLYLRWGQLGDDAPEVIALSEELRQRAFHPDAGTREDFRNPNGVSLKLANFASLDPAYPGVGMPALGVGDEQSWERYAGDLDLLAEAVAKVRADGTPPIEGVSGDTPAPRTERKPIEAQHVLEYEVGPTESTFASRTESELVQRFAAWLEAEGSSVSSHHHRAGVAPLRTDLCDDTERRVWEAKGTTSRSAIRMAVGQLLDYRRFEDDEWSIGVLVPREPTRDLLAYIASVGAAVARPDGEDSFLVVEPPS